jgi:hypothetical protein
MDTYYSGYTVHLFPLRFYTRFISARVGVGDGFGHWK